MKNRATGWLRHADRRLGAALLACGVMAAGPAACAADAAPGAAATNALRIVSLGPAITEQIVLLDRGAWLVGVTTYCRIPEPLKTPVRIGTLTGINVEEITALNPDLVLAVGLTHPRQMEKLAGLGIRVHRFTYPRNFSEICEQYLELGRLLDCEDAARAMVDKARADAERLTGRLTGLGKPTVFVQVGARPLFTAGSDSYIHDLVETAGAVNVARDSGAGFYSREKVIADNPDVILVVTMGLAAEEEKRGWEQLSSLKAVKNRAVHIVDADLVCSTTPPRFVEALRLLSDLFHPAKESTP